MQAPPDTASATASKITEEAIRIIAAAPEHGPLRPLEYAEALPPRAAALARVLMDEKIVEAARRYQRADKRAITAQRWFVWIGKTAAYTGFLAAVLGGALLYIASDASGPSLFAVGALQFGFLVVSLTGSLALYAVKPFRAWRKERGQAEAERLNIFTLFMSDTSAAGESEAPLLPLKLECFRRHLLDDQLAYFKWRGPQHRRVARRWFRLRVLALILIGAACLPLLARLEAFSWLPDWLRTVIAWLPLKGGDVQQKYALLGLLGGALQGLLAALAVISLADRNADKFEAMLERLEGYSQEKLSGARLAATKGDGIAVGEFVRQVVSDLAAEATEWVTLQAALSEMTLKLIAHQHKIPG